VVSPASKVMICSAIGRTSRQYSFHDSTLGGAQTQAQYGALPDDVSKQSVMQYEKGLARPTKEAMAKLGIERCYRVQK
jgi:hypothetical protein